MAWNVSVLPGAEGDLDALASGDKRRREELENAILDEFEGMKGARVHKLFRQGVATSSIDRLEGSQFPGSIRLQVFADYRATALCFPEYEQATLRTSSTKDRIPGTRTPSRSTTNA